MQCTERHVRQGCGFVLSLLLTHRLPRSVTLLVLLYLREPLRIEIIGEPSRLECWRLEE